MNQNHDYVLQSNGDEVRLNDELLEKHIRNLPLAVIEWDKSFAITRWCGEAENIFGWSDKEVIGKTMDDFPLFFSEDLSKAHETMNRLHAARCAVSTFRNCRRDGSIIHCQWYNSIVTDRSGNAVSMLSLISDITKQHNAEVERELLLGRELKRRTDAENANRMKDQFLATLSHELRSPMNVILAWTKILRTSAPDEETLGRAIDAIDRSAQLQSRLIADILDVSRIISGKMSIERIPVKLQGVVGASIENIRLLADSKQISLHAEINSAIPPIVGDQNRLQQVFWNLLNNAVKFTPKNGEIRVALYHQSDHAIVTVRDNGEGIQQDFLPYVFDRFSQADDMRNKTHGGLGIGLAIARHVVVLHGGSIEVHSDGPGKGTVFTLRFPLMKSAPA